jgi:transcriptional regulator with XRE-family HTH domain
MELSEKLKAVRQKEGLTQMEFCRLLEISISTYKKQEMSLRAEISSAILLKITHHPRFEKFALWLMTDKTCIDCGQVSPIVI